MGRSAGGPPGRANNFDLLRIFAASQVMLSHAIAHLHVAVPAAWMKMLYAFPGVPIFFVISGFLISASYERSPGLGQFCRNRALRIFPGLWCCVFATVLVAELFGYSFLHAGAVAWMVAQLAGVIYTPGFLAGFGTGSYNGSLWTIPVELQFYVTVPIVYWLLARRREHASAWLAAGWLACVAVGFATSRYAAPHGGEAPLGKLLRYSLMPHFFLFLTGVLMQRAGFQKVPWIAGKGLWWLAAYVVFRFNVSGAGASYVLSTLLLAVVTVSMAHTVPGASRRVLRGNDISYGVYIYHGLLINVFVELGLQGPAWLPCLLVCAYLVGYLSWVMIERPFLRRKGRTSTSEAAPAVELPRVA